MKEQKRTAWLARINKRKTGALLLAFCMLGSVVGCTSGSEESAFNSNENPFYGGSSESSGSLGDYENGSTVGSGSSSDSTTDDYETEDVVSGGSSDSTTDDYETDEPNLGNTDVPTGSWDDYIGEEEEGANLPSDLVDDPYRKDGGYAYFYHHQHSPTTMPIAAWSSPPPDTTTTIGEFTTNQITLENYQKIAEAGFNTVYGLYETLHGVVDVDKTNVTNALNYANQTGLVYYVKDTSVRGNLIDYGSSALENYYGWYMNKAAYGGTLMVDEPGVDSFATLAAAQVEWNNSKYAKIKNMYVNHLPSYASYSQLYYGAGDTSSTPPKNYTWAEFVEEYITSVSPVNYSYDFYPFRGGSAQFSNYYSSLSTAKQKSAAGNIPFWVFCQVGYFNMASTLTYAQTAIQVSTALAYGAKGIQWFNYWHPLEFSASWISGCVDHYGVKTMYYPWVQTINNHVAAVDDVLMQCKNVGVIQVGSSYDTIPSSDLLGSYGALTSTSGSSGNALIGCFEYRDTGKYVYYIASNSYTADASVNLTFNGTYNVRTVKGTTSTDYANRSSFTVNIPKGDGVLVVVG